jgi:hypothetical protein
VVGRNTGTDTWSLIRLRGFRNLSELDEFDRKSRWVIIEKDEKSRNVEMENPIWVHLLVLAG